MNESTEWKFGTTGFTTPDGFSWKIRPVGDKKGGTFPHMKKLAACAPVLAFKDPAAVEIMVLMVATLQQWRKGPGVGFNTPMMGEGAEGMTLGDALDLIQLKMGVPQE